MGTQGGRLDGWGGKDSEGSEEQILHVLTVGIAAHTMGINSSDALMQSSSLGKLDFCSI